MTFCARVQQHFGANYDEQQITEIHFYDSSPPTGPL